MSITALLMVLFLIVLGVLIALAIRTYVPLDDRIKYLIIVLIWIVIIIKIWGLLFPGF